MGKKNRNSGVRQEGLIFRSSCSHARKFAWGSKIPVSMMTSCVDPLISQMLQRLPSKEFNSRIRYNQSWTCSA